VIISTPRTRPQLTGGGTEGDTHDPLNAHLRAHTSPHQQDGCHIPYARCPHQWLPCRCQGSLLVNLLQVVERHPPRRASPTRLRVDSQAQIPSLGRYRLHRASCLPEEHLPSHPQHDISFRPPVILPVGRTSSVLGGRVVKDTLVFPQRLSVSCRPPNNKSPADHTAVYTYIYIHNL
ncbi:hypothetical protein OTU49_009009, partial [Cherax quadricarinatus]